MSGVRVTSDAQARERVTVIGTRISQGNAVECPQIRDDSGRVHGVSYLSPSIAIGDRVSVTGRYVVMATCVGRVIHAEHVVILGRD